MAGSVTQAYYELGTIRKVVFDCTADATAATFPDTELTTKIEGFLLNLETNPGATGPTDNYNITLEDAEGYDVLEGAGGTRDILNTEKADIPIGTYHHPCVTKDDTLTLKIADNAVNSATTKIILYYSPASG